MSVISELQRYAKEHPNFDPGNRMICQRKSNHKGRCYMLFLGMIFSWKKEHE